MSQFNLDKVSKTLERVPDEFRGKVAQVGFPQGISYENGTHVAYVAAIQEFGAPEMSIPARPFMRPAVQKHREDWVSLMASMVPEVVSGRLTAFDVLDAVGIDAQTDMQVQIKSIDSPPLSPITVMLRKWRKDGRTITGKTVAEAAEAVAAGEDPGNDNKPLQDTGNLYASIHHAVNTKGGKFSV